MLKLRSERFADLRREIGIEALQRGEGTEVDDESLVDFFTEVELLARHPLVGQARPELDADLRSFSAGNYVIFFRPITDGIQVVRVLHGSRDITAIFDVDG